MFHQHFSLITDPSGNSIDNLNVVSLAYLRGDLGVTCGSRWRWSSRFLPLCGLRRQSLDIRLIHIHQDVLWLYISVNDLTLGVQVVQALQNLQRERDKTQLLIAFDLLYNQTIRQWMKNMHLSNNALDTRQRQALVVGLNNPLQQMVAEDFKHHTHIWQSMLKGNDAERISGALQEHKPKAPAHCELFSKNKRAESGQSAESHSCGSRDWAAPKSKYRIHWKHTSGRLTEIYACTVVWISLDNHAKVA